MKQLAKKYLPKLMTRFAQTLRAKSTYRASPSIMNFQDHSDAVLQCCIAYNKYGGYCVPLSSRHRPAAKKILAGDIWEPVTIEFLMSHCGSSDIVHAGTFFGDFLPALSQSLAPGATVWAFEPQPENYRCALITTYINGLENVIELRNAGLGERQGSLSMMTADPDGRSLGGSSRIVKQCGDESSISVQIVTIDDIVPSDRNVSIIQLDVEGFEQPALSGALMTIRRCRPILVLETLPEERWLSENILQLGYRIDGTIHDNTVLRAE
jgi:FkbM family methyltransferase